MIIIIIIIILGSALPPRRCSACSYLIRYAQAQIVKKENRQQQQGRKMPHHRPRHGEEIRTLTKTSSVKSVVCVCCLHILNYNLTVTGQDASY